MKRMLLCLLILFGMTSFAAAEEIAPEFRMELSQTVFTGPEEVTVTITVSNPSDQDMPGPLALYWPDGRIIREFGTPTLKAGESLTWEGTWFVTEAQLNDGRVIFAIMYTTLQEDGSLCRKTQPYYDVVMRLQTETPTVELLLESNPSTGYDWTWVTASSLPVRIDKEYVSDWQMENEDDILPPGTGGHTRITLNGITPGKTTIAFVYKRAWEEKEPLYTLTYHLQVDEKLNVTILGTSFDWNP